ncbi:MAG TPA: RHS repeat-associated core domain-containing protein [Bacillota bacterium]|nr:RHS repeat-associated core domain-containing protein [Bacillota bacterium]HOL09478.1 RHS repeat-associated core domain-containing protein [Bacillota bacterium]HPO97560.1 RHS repeat-associated core domain-containing protein [Bacillota bacterium]
MKDQTPPADPYATVPNYDNPYLEVEYDLIGNKIKERDADGVTVTYTYTVRNWLYQVFDHRGRLQKEYRYDKKGNPIGVKDALGKIRETKYDSLGRVRRVIDPQTEVNYTYDPLGNRTEVKDGRGNTTFYSYNDLGWLTMVRDPLHNITQYRYDPNGNVVEIEAPNKLLTVNQYDELNRLTVQQDPSGNLTTYSYNRLGNRDQVIDRRGTVWTYQYYDNNLLRRLDLVGTDGSKYWVEYQYDAAGNRTTVTDSGNIIKYNHENGVYQADPLNRINNIERNFDGASYRTSYQYSPAGQLTGIKYSGALSFLEYRYNDLNQLSEVIGFTKPEGINYRIDGALEKVTYKNGAVVSYNYDLNNRLDDFSVTIGGKQILIHDYTYDANGNITQLFDGKNTRIYEYDKNNQLVKATTPGKFLENTVTAGDIGIKAGDLLGTDSLNFTPVEQGIVGIDYNSTSIGIDFGKVAPAIKVIQIVPNKDHQSHRVTDRALELFTSKDNQTFSVIPRSKWEHTKDTAGVITITLKETVATRYLKIHVKFDDRDAKFRPVNKAQFLNNLAKMLRVYQEASVQIEEFGYDAAGNRDLQKITLVQTQQYDLKYYQNSDRLKTDGKYAYVYDNAGNLIQKGNRFTIDGETVTFTTSGEGVEYWTYDYDLLNRLIWVTKNGTIVAEYGYDPTGLRVVKKAKGVTTHYVFEGTEPIYEKRLSDGRIKSYVYAFGKHLARVDGNIGDPNAKVYYYHTDHLGSIKAVSDEAGKVVYQSDYHAFGTQFAKDGEFDETHGFNGKEFDEDTGLYYYNARWYDAELGRFISEDPMMDPNNPNLYTYCSNNPVNKIDPTGYYAGEADWSTPENSSETISRLRDIVSRRENSGSGSSSSSSGSTQVTIGARYSWWDGKGIKETKVIDSDGKELYVLEFDKDGNLKAMTSFEYKDGDSKQRTSFKICFTKYGLVTVKSEQTRNLFGWKSKDVEIKGYLNNDDYLKDNWHFKIQNDLTPIC